MVLIILRGAPGDHAAVLPAARITFSRAALRRFGLVATATFAMFGCAPSKPPLLEPRASVAPSGAAYATVASVRPIRAFAAAGIDPQTAILTAMSDSQSGPAMRGSSSEIVVRTDGGETLSVVQPDSAELAPGERVIVVPGGLPRLVPAPPHN